MIAIVKRLCYKKQIKLYQEHNYYDRRLDMKELFSIKKHYYYKEETGSECYHIINIYTYNRRKYGFGKS